MRRALLIAAWLACGPAVLAQDGAERLAVLERRAADRSLSLREREGAADGAIEARRALIRDAATGEARLPGWLVDQGAALLARLGRDGSDTAVLLALPTAAQEKAVGEAAAEADGLLGRAQGLLPKESREELATRAAFFRARALLLRGAAGAGDRAALAGEAHGLVSGMALANPGPEAVRRVTVGLGLLRRAGSSEEDARAALEEFAWVAAGGRESGSIAGASAVPSPTRAEGWLGLLQAARRLGTLDAAVGRVEGALGQPPFTVDGGADPLLVVLAHDAMTRALFEAGVAARPPDAALLERGLVAQERLFSRADLGFDASTLRPLGAEKLALLASRAPAGAALPAGYRLARAVVLAREASGRAEALRLFAEIAGDAGAGAARAEALWELAVLRTAPGEPAAGRAEAVRALLRLAREFPAHARAPQAAGAAVEFARGLAEEGAPGAGALYHGALVLATEAFASQKPAPRWAYERVRLDVQGPAETGELSAALARLRAIETGAAGGLEEDLVRMGDRGHAALLGALWEEARRRRAAGSAEELRAWAGSVLVPEARAAAAWAVAHGAPSRARFELDVALALTESGDAGGLAALRRMAASPGAAAYPGGVQHVRLGLARAELLAGDTAGAFRLLTEIASALDAPAAEPGAPARRETFWHAWTLMLETLVAQDREGAQRGAIRAHITRLRSIDAGLGGEPWARRIGAVAARVAE